MRHFHQIAAKRGAIFALLRIGLADADEEYPSGAKWRQKFYGMQGWIKLSKPDDTPIFWEWMYRPLSPNFNKLAVESVYFAQPMRDGGWPGCLFAYNADLRNVID